MPQDMGLTAETSAALASWARATGLRLLVVFGSASEGTAQAGSDVDIAVDLLPLPSPTRRLEMIGQVQDACGPRRADVVFLTRDTSPVLRFEVFRTGRPLHEDRPGRFVEEVVRALSLYHDALPLRRRLLALAARGSST